MAKYDRWYKVELSLRMDNADIADEDAVIVAGNVPFAGKIKEAWCGAAVLPTTATLALAKGSTNILTDATVDVAALTAGTAAKQTLAAGVASLRVAAGDMLTATWTFTVIGPGDGFAAQVWIEPDEF